MILAIDIGNTNIFIGAIDNKKTYFVERITTTIGKTNLEYAITLKSILEIYQIEPKEIEGGIISSVEPPLFVELEITDTEPGFKGDTAQGATKPAVVETGATVYVPLFVDQGDKIKIDTRTGEYLSRV